MGDYKSIIEQLEQLCYKEIAELREFLDDEFPEEGMELLNK